MNCYLCLQKTLCANVCAKKLTQIIRQLSRFSRPIQPFVWQDKSEHIMTPFNLPSTVLQSIPPPPLSTHNQPNNIIPYRSVQLFVWQDKSVHVMTRLYLPSTLLQSIPFVNSHCQPINIIRKSVDMKRGLFLCENGRQKCACNDTDNDEGYSRFRGVL